MAVLLSKADDIEHIVGLYRISHSCVHQLFFFGKGGGYFWFELFLFLDKYEKKYKNNYRNNRIPDTGLALS